MKSNITKHSKKTKVKTSHKARTGSRKNRNKHQTRRQLYKLKGGSGSNQLPPQPINNNNNNSIIHYNSLRVPERNLDRERMTKLDELRESELNERDIEPEGAAAAKLPQYTSGVFTGEAITPFTFPPGISPPTWLPIGNERNPLLKTHTTPNTIQNKIPIVLTLPKKIIIPESEYNLESLIKLNANFNIELSKLQRNLQDKEKELNSLQKRSKLPKSDKLSKSSKSSKSSKTSTTSSTNLSNIEKREEIYISRLQKLITNLKDKIEETEIKKEDNERLKKYFKKIKDRYFPMFNNDKDFNLNHYNLSLLKPIPFQEIQTFGTLMSGHLTGINHDLEIIIRQIYTNLSSLNSVFIVSLINLEKLVTIDKDKAEKITEESHYFNKLLYYYYCIVLISKTNIYENIREQFKFLKSNLERINTVKQTYPDSQITRFLDEAQKILELYHQIASEAQDSYDKIFILERFEENINFDYIYSLFFNKYSINLVQAISTKIDILKSNNKNNKNNKKTISYRNRFNILFEPRSNNNVDKLINDEIIPKLRLTTYWFAVQSLFTFLDIIKSQEFNHLINNQKIINLYDFENIIIGEEQSYKKKFNYSDFKIKYIDPKPKEFHIIIAHRDKSFETDSKKITGTTQYTQLLNCDKIQDNAFIIYANCNKYPCEADDFLIALLNSYYNNPPFTCYIYSNDKMNWYNGRKNLVEI